MQWGIELETLYDAKAKPGLLNSLTGGQSELLKSSSVRQCKSNAVHTAESASLLHKVRIVISPWLEIHYANGRDQHVQFRAFSLNFFAIAAIHNTINCAAANAAQRGIRTIMPERP